MKVKRKIEHSPQDEFCGLIINGKNLSKCRYRKEMQSAFKMIVDSQNFSNSIILYKVSDDNFIIYKSFYYYIDLLNEDYELYQKSLVEFVDDEYVLSNWIPL